MGSTLAARLSRRTNHAATAVAGASVRTAGASRRCGRAYHSLTPCRSSDTSRAISAATRFLAQRACS